jgi:uncharacterized integral membrane protein
LVQIDAVNGDQHQKQSTVLPAARTSRVYHEAYALAFTLTRHRFFILIVIIIIIVVILFISELTTAHLCFTGREGFPFPIGSRSFPAMLFLRNIQAQRPDSLFFRPATEEEISQFSAVFAGWRRKTPYPATFALISAAPSGNHAYSYEYFLVRRVGAVFAGSSGQTCLG